MKAVFTYLSVLILSGLASFGLLSGTAQYLGNGSFGAFNYVSSGTYKLAGGGVSSSDTSIAVDNFLSPISNNQYNMANDFGDIGYATLEPGSQTKKEFISFTGISYSGNRATLSGVTRGLDFKAPYTASTTLRQSHAGGTTLIISNPPQLYAKLAGLTNNEWITGTWGFGSLPTTSVPCTLSEQFCNKDYIDGISVQGGATSTETNMGLTELSTRAELAAGTASSSTQKPLVIPNKMAHATPGSCNSVACIPVAVAGKLAQAFLDLTAAFTWTGPHTFSNLFSTNASSTNATTTTTLGLGVLSYLLPSGAPAASSSVMTVGGTSPYRLSWSPPMRSYGAVLTDGPASVAAGFASTTMSLSIPAGALTASTTIRVTLGGSCDDSGGGGGTCTFYLRNSNGDTFASGATSQSGTSNESFTASFDIIATSLTAQSYVAAVNTVSQGTPTTGGFSSNASTATVNLANAQTFVVVAHSSNASINIAAVSVIVTP